MGCYIGIDGGGSKSELLLCDDTGKVLKHIIADGSNPADAGIERSISIIEGLVSNAGQGTHDSDIRFISICVPGLKRYRHLIKVLSRFENRTEITGDEQNAFYGSLAGEYGILILSGTGSFAMGINREGMKCTVGGWGPKIGDEGSGYYMGIKALKAVTEEYDGIGRSTLLTELIKDGIGIHSTEELRSVLYTEKFGVKEIASMSRHVKHGAELGDSVCIDIIDDCACRLFLLADAVIKRLGMGSGEYDLCLAGGLSNFGQYILDPLGKYIHLRYPEILIKKPELTPAAGSIIMGFKRDGRKFSVENGSVLKESMKEVHVDVI